MRKSGEVSKRFSNHLQVFKLESLALTTLDSSLILSPDSLMIEFELQEYREDFVQSFFDMVQPSGMILQCSVYFVKSVPVILFGCHDGRDGVVVDDYRLSHSIHIVVVAALVEVKSLERPFEGSSR